MASALLAILLAVIVGHTVPDLARVREYHWFASWIGSAGRSFGQQAFWRSAGGLVLTLGVPLLAVALLQWLLHDRFFGLASFALGAVALFYAWGPRDLDLDVETLASAGDAESRQQALLALGGGEAPQYQADALVDATFRAALRRWFGPLFWFVVLGASGAIAYRLVQLAAREARVCELLPSAQQRAAERVAQLLDWPVAHLMTLALAVASDFDDVASAWRDWHALPGHSGALDIGFLGAAAQSTVDLDEDEAGGDAYVEPAPGPTAALGQSLALVWRVLVVWLAVLALMVLAGFIG
jgi:AmpE protein